MNNDFLVYEREIQSEIRMLNEMFLINQPIKHPDVELYADFSFAVFIPEESCESIENEIPHLNKIYSFLGPYFRAYLLADENTLTSLESYQAKFPYQIIDPYISIVNNNHYFNTPVAVILDSTGVIKNALVTDLWKIEENVQFYQEVITLFQTGQINN